MQAKTVGQQTGNREAEVFAGKIQVQLRRVTHGRDVPWAVPGGFDPELFREDGYLSRRRRPPRQVENIPFCPLPSSTPNAADKQLRV